MPPSKALFSSRSFSIASSMRLRSLAAIELSLRGTDRRRLSTEPISSLPLAFASTRIELERARAGRSVNRIAGRQRNFAQPRHLRTGRKDHDGGDA
jgi:hypothetical protein